VLDHESCFAHRGEGFFARYHVGDSVAALDGEADGGVAGVGGVVGVGHYPLVQAEDAAGFEGAVDLRVDASEGGGVDGGFDGVGGVEGVWREVGLLRDG